MDESDDPVDLGQTDVRAGDGRAAGSAARAARGRPSTSCPRRATIFALVAESISARRSRIVARRLVLHSLKGCLVCAQGVAESIGHPRFMAEPPPDRFDFFVARAIKSVLSWLHSTEGSPPARQVAADRARALLEEARNLLRSEPEEALELLDAARSFAREAQEPILEADVYVERANLHRLLGDHWRAETDFRAALALYPSRSECAEALLRLGDLYASFLIARRRFADADLLLDRLIRAFHERGDAARAGKLSLMRAIGAGYAGDPASALLWASRALANLRGTEVIALRLNAIQAAIAYNVQLGDFDEAMALSTAVRGEYRRHMDLAARNKFTWLDGQIHAGLGRLAMAERYFLAAKDGFEKLGLPFQAALVGLELAALLVERNRSREAQRLIAGELVPTFRSIGIAREGLASLVLLERAAESSAFEAAAIRSILREIERAGQAPEMHREADDEVEDFD